MVLSWALLLSAASATPLPDWVGAAVADRVSAPGATALQSVAEGESDAIVLLHSTTVQFTSPDQAQTRHRVVVWVGTEGNRSLLPTAQSYHADTERVISAQAWTVSADGKNVRSFRRNSFSDSVTQFNDISRNAQRSLGFDARNVEAGGFVACQFEIASLPGTLGSTCDFQSSLYVLKAQFEAEPAPGTVLLWHASSPGLIRPTAGARPGSLRWEVARLAPFAQGLPSGFLANPLTVAVRCVPRGADASVDQAWEEQSRLAAGMIEGACEANATLRAQAARLTEGSTDRWEKIRSLTEFVQRQIVSVPVNLDKDNLASFQPHPATQVLHDRSGDSKDKAVLLIALLQAIGEEAHVLLLHRGNPAAVAADWPSLDFNHAIVGLAVDKAVPPGWPVVVTAHSGAMTLFDPTDPFTPFGFLPRADQGGYALLVAAKTGELVKVPTTISASNGLERTIYAHYRAGEVVAADVEENRSGLAAAQIYAFRFTEGAKKFNQALEARIHRATPLAKNLVWTETWDARAPRYHLGLQFQAGGLVRPLDEDRELISPQLLPVGETFLPWASEREGVVWLPPSAITEETHWPVPDGYRIEELPEAWAEKSALAGGRVSYRIEGKSVIYRTELFRPGGFLDKSHYEEIRIFYQKLHEAQRRPLVFRRLLPA
jgi:hypothetical protein